MENLGGLKAFMTGNANFQKLSSSDQKFLLTYLEKLDKADDYEYSDNYRFAIVGQPLQENKYNSTQDQGCCGFFDKEIILPSKTKIKLGFNFGH